MTTESGQQPDWVKGVLDRYCELGDQKEKLFEWKDDWPDWVRNLLVILAGVSHPGTKLKRVKRWNAKELGRFLGRQYAGEHLTEGEVPLSPRVKQESERSVEWAEKRLEQTRPDEILTALLPALEEAQRTWRAMWKNFIKDVLATACEQPYPEASAYFDGFGRGIVIKPDDLLTERRMGVGDKVSWTMLAMWRDIERLESVAQLHRVFEQALKPQGIVVTYKRIEKLCQRIGLKFKGRGRPPGKKNQTKSAGV